MELRYTLDEVRDRETAHFGPVRWPVPWWPQGPRVSYCVGWQTIQLGLRDGSESTGYLGSHPHLISIAAFRMHYRWPEVAPDDIEPGDLVLSNWTGNRIDGDLEAEHMEWAYSRPGGIVIVGANTGPSAGDALPNGVWKKLRPLDRHIVRGIRPPYKPHKPSRARRNEVIAVAMYVNEHVHADIPRTKAIHDGIVGKNYWALVQTYGRHHGWYPSEYVIDGIPGPKTRQVEDTIYRVARARR